MSERCIFAMAFLREERVLPFPNLPRQDNDGENKATELCCIATHEQSFIRIANSVPGVFGAFCATKSTQRKTTERIQDNSLKVENYQQTQTYPKLLPVPLKLLFLRAKVRATFYPPRLSATPPCKR